MTYPAGRIHAVLFVILCGLVLLLPFVVYKILLMKIMCFAIFAMAFNLLLGFGGLMSFGHAAFFGLGSYMAAHGAKELGFSAIESVVFAMVLSGLLGLIFGWIALKRQGIYFAMISLALAQLVFYAIWRADFAGGENGIQAVPRGMFLGMVDLSNDWNIYVLFTLIFLGCTLLVYRIVHSPFGQIVKGIRDNEARAISIGYDTARFKLILFVLSATLSGLGGGLKAIVLQFATLTDVHWVTSGEVVLMVLVGGIGTLAGPIVGAAIMVVVHDYLAWLGPWVMVVQGSIFILTVLLFRQGIIGTIGRKLGISL
ncbi:branched-chain amino acid ABC transporter permease [Fertoebacter nigrum]|uniref:Branched-chain amino acid ABC transporter permease n=1 Tax=Fertoeibacter niger TaxID=2656921 RepID=A0A8X8H2D8_9RHOB|nr:branched-chain amino acid ABC transporter permease [Fertoeibacter niger]NUB45029.1 branched-chain amino acid ABC transporter permease [Fertoeibacter niger]